MVGALQRAGGGCEPVTDDHKMAVCLPSRSCEQSPDAGYSVVRPGQPRYKAVDLLESERDYSLRRGNNQGGTAEYISSLKLCMRLQGFLFFLQCTFSPTLCSGDL